MTADTAPALPGLSVDDRVRAAAAACPNGIRPTTLEHALDLAGELRAVTEQLEEAGELAFEHGRLHVAADAPGDAARTVLASLKEDDAAALHARLARAIGRTSYEPGVAEVEQAAHELRAGDRDRALERLDRAARDAMRSADHALVVRAVDQLVEAGAEPSPELRELHARAAHECGDPRAPKLWLESLNAWDEDGDLVRAARAAVAWFWSAPESSEAAARLELEAAVDAPAADPGRVGWAAYARAVRALVDARWADAIEPREDALGAARDAGDRGLEAAVLGSLATARSYLGQLDLSIELLRRCAPLAAADSDAVAVRRARHNLVETLVEALRTREAIDEAGRFTADVQRMGARHYVPGALALEARVHAIAGDAAQARSLASTALAQDRALDEPQRDVYVHMVAAELLALGGATERFRGFVDDVSERCRELGFDSYDEALDEVRGRAALVDGDAAALARVLDAARASEATGMANLAVSAARLLVEHDDAELRAALTAQLERMRALSDAEREVPLVRLAIREADAALARDVDALDGLAADLDAHQRPVDAALLRRALLALRPDEVEASRLSALLESQGWTALAHRPLAGAPADDETAAAPVVDIALFTALPAAERAAVFNVVERHELLPPTDTDSPTPPAGLCVIASGEVRLLRAEPGTTDRRLVVAALGPGDVFGHDSLVADGASNVGDLVEAATPTVLHVVPRAALETVTTAAPSFATAVLADASDRLREARMLAGESALLPVETRLARTLVRLGERFGRPSLRGEQLLDTSLTHADIASMIGSQRARVSSLLGALHKAGVTDTWKRRIVVLDTAELRRRASLEAAPPAKG